MKKWKLAPFYKGKFVNKHRIDVKPFPGVSSLRWAIYNPAHGAIKYEGKPSYQALDIIMAYTKKTQKRLLLCEFDKGGPILVVVFYNGDNFEVSDAHWNVWAKYHGDVSVQKAFADYGRNRNDTVPQNAKIG